MTDRVARDRRSGLPVRSALLRLGVLVTHPVQYYAPLFRRLALEPGVDLTVYFAHRPTAEQQGEGFGVAFHWDVDLTAGYDHLFLRNVAERPSAGTFDGCDTPEIGRTVRDGAFDAFLVMGWHARSYWQAMWACWSARVPVLVRGDSQLAPASAALKRTVKRAVYPLFMRRFAACLSVGQRSAEYFRHYGARRVIPSPHFVDNEFFASRAAEAAPRRAELRRRWGADDASAVVLFAGKLQPKKRPLDVVRALAAARRPNLRLLVAGDGELRDACEREAATLGVAAAFAGFLNQTEIPEAYAAADVLALPSDERETWGLVVNEAMASGRPAVVSRAVGCTPDLVLDGVTGWSHALGDVAALARLFERVADDPGLAKRAGEAARAHVAPFSLEAAAGGVLEAARTAARAREAA